MWEEEIEIKSAGLKKHNRIGGKIQKGWGISRLGWGGGNGQKDWGLEIGFGGGVIVLKILGSQERVKKVKARDLVGGG